jgi:hypothetical protein
MDEIIFQEEEISISLTPELFFNLFANIYKEDKDVAKVKQFAFIFITLFVSIGFFGNLISMLTFLNKKLLMNKFNWYLLIVSVFKQVFCLTLFIDFVFSKIDVKEIFLHDFNKITNKIIDFSIHTSDSCIAFLTIFISLDRIGLLKNRSKINEFITRVQIKFLITTSLSGVILLKALNLFVCDLDIQNTKHALYCTIVSPFVFNLFPYIVILILNIISLFLKFCFYKNQKIVTNNLAKKSLLTILELQEIRRKSKVELEEIVPIKQKSLPKQYSSNRKFSIQTHSTNEEILKLKDLKKMSLIQISSQCSRTLDKYNYEGKILHFLIIIISTIWSILTRILYFSLNSYFILFQLNFLKLETAVMLQIVSSVFYNLNHSLNVFVYFSFYENFRAILIDNFLSKLFCKKSSQIDLI